MARRLILAAAGLLAAVTTLGAGGEPHTLTVTNDKGIPIPGAWIAWNDGSSTSGQDGVARLPAMLEEDTLLRIAKPGYFPWCGSLGRAKDASSLPVFTPEGLYLTPFGLAHRGLREHALMVAREGKLNALVIDFKGDRGYLTTVCDLPFAKEVGANGRPTIKDLPSLLEELKGQGFYLIARIVVFKDDQTGRAKPEWAVKRFDGSLYVDREGLVWTDPFRDEVREYNLDLAEEAAIMGFDEIQFDYIRFPVPHDDLVFSKKHSREARVGAIAGFLKEAQQRMHPFAIPVSADIFGYVPWNQGDVQIGQDFEPLLDTTDSLCLMLYPSGYHAGIPGLAGSTVLFPGETVRRTLQQASSRKNAHGSKTLLLGWLQNFKDYTSLKKPYQAKEIRAQIEAMREAGSGFFLWDPSNKYTYTLDALQPKDEES